MHKVLSTHKESTVYLVEHTQLGLKRIIKRISHSSPHFEQMAGEAAVMKNLCHPAIPLIYDVEDDGDYLYIIEQYIEGESLTDICRKSLLSENKIIDLAIQICDIVVYLHSQNPPVLYLDLKPDNIIVADGRAALIDFGSAVCQDGKQCCISGTKGFASPEQEKGKDIGKRADVYGIGSLLLFMAAGGKEQKKSIRCMCSGELAAVIMRSLKQQQSLRYRSVEMQRKRLIAISKQSTLRPLRMAVAGVTQNVGVTHISIMLTALLHRCRGECIYVECNESQAVSRLAAECGALPERGAAILEGMRFLLQKGGDLHSCGEGNESTVFDYGQLSIDNLQQFLDADVSCLVMCCRPWEIPEAQTAIRLCEGMEHVKIIFNMTSTERARKAGRTLKLSSYLCMHYLENPFDAIGDRNSRGLLPKLLM